MQNYLSRENIYLSPCVDVVSIERKIRHALQWYYANEFNKLIFRIHVTGDEPSRINSLVRVVRDIHTSGNAFKQDPAVEIIAPVAALENDLLDAIGQVDTQSPRLLVLGSASDTQGFDVNREAIAAAIAGAAQRHIRMRLHFSIKSDVDAVNTLGEFLKAEIEKDEGIARSVLGHAPVIDISPFIRIENIKAFVKAIAGLWQAFPWLDESIPYSASGPMQMFFQTKEQMFLESLDKQGKQVPPAMPGTGVPGQGRPMTLNEAFVSHVRQELMQGDDRMLAPFLRKMIALDNDWDFVFDSYECQSPVFIPDWEASNA